MEWLRVPASCRVSPGPIPTNQVCGPGPDLVRTDQLVPGPSFPDQYSLPRCTQPFHSFSETYGTLWTSGGYWFYRFWIINNNVPFCVILCWMTKDKEFGIFPILGFIIPRFHAEAFQPTGLCFSSSWMRADRSTCWLSLNLWSDLTSYSLTATWPRRRRRAAYDDDDDDADADVWICVNDSREVCARHNKARVGYFKNGNSRLSPTSHFSDAMREMWYENSQSPLPITSQVGCGKISRPNILDWEVGSLKVGSGTQTRMPIFKISYSGYITRRIAWSRKYREMSGVYWCHLASSNLFICAP